MLSSSSTPSRQVSLTTGLLTLSVHEALTFERVKIALHPDLFLNTSNSVAVSVAAVSGGGVGGSGGTSSGVAGGQSPSTVVGIPAISGSNHAASSSTTTPTGTAASISATLPVSYGSVPSPSDPLTPRNYHHHNHETGIATPPGGTSTPGTPASSYITTEQQQAVIGSRVNNTVGNTTNTPQQQVIASTNSNNAALKVGDLVEIRVWDTKPGVDIQHHTGVISSQLPLSVARQQSHDVTTNTINTTGTSADYNSPHTTTTTNVNININTATTSINSDNNGVIINSNNVSIHQQQTSSLSKSPISNQSTLMPSPPHLSPNKHAQNLQQQPHQKQQQQQNLPPDFFLSPRNNAVSMPPITLSASPNNKQTPLHTSNISTTTMLNSHSGNAAPIMNTTPPSINQTTSMLQSMLLNPTSTNTRPNTSGLKNKGNMKNTENSTSSSTPSSTKEQKSSNDNKHLPTGLEEAEVAARERRMSTGGSPKSRNSSFGRSYNTNQNVVERNGANGNSVVGSSGNSTIPPMHLTGVNMGENHLHQQHHPHQQQQHQRSKDPINIIAATHNLRFSFVMILEEKSLTTLKSAGRTKISILRQVADLYNLSSYDMVTVTKIDKSEEASVMESVNVDFVTITIKDQFISRGELYQFQHSFLSKLIYSGERLATNDGMRGTVMEIRHGDREAKYGIISSDTKFTFRSRSARIIWLVQISSEMWDYTSPYEAEGWTQTASPRKHDKSCEIYFDKFVSFMYRLFEKWKELEVTHSLTVLFFSRTYLYSKGNSGFAKFSPNSDKFGSSAVQEDVDGRLYEDHFKVVIENETRADWSSLVYRIKKEFVNYPAELAWKVSSDQCRIPSTAAQGNILEAINTTLNLLQLHYMDRDLHRTGNSVVIVSAGSGVFEVDKGLAGITKQRMMDNGIGSDMLSLGLPPLHVAPFFLYNQEGTTPHADEAHGFDDWKTIFEIPHWMHLSFISYDKNGTVPTALGKETNVQYHSVAPQVQIMANGFIVQQQNNIQSLMSTVDKVDSCPSVGNVSKQTTSATQNHQRHLISGRDFEDILEACRPRNRGESIGGMPSALTSLLRKFVNTSTRKAKKNIFSSDSKSKGSITNTSHENLETSPACTTSLSLPNNNPSNDNAPIEEWGAVSFDALDCGAIPYVSMATINNDHGSQTSPHLLSPEHIRLNRERQGSSSDKSSPSSSFTSNYSFLLGRSPGSYYQHSPSINGIQIQQSSSFDIPLLSIDNNCAVMKKIRSEDSLSTICVDESLVTEKSFSPKPINSSNTLDNLSLFAQQTSNKIVSIESLRNFMSQYDSNVFRSQPKDKKNAPHAGRENSSSWSNAPRRMGVDLGVPVSHEGISAQDNSHQLGGIGAALVQFNNSGQPVVSHHDMGGIKRIKKNAASSTNLRFLTASSNYARPHSFGYGQDKNMALPPASDLGDAIRARPSVKVTATTPYSTSYAKSDSTFFVGSLQSSETPTRLACLPIDTDTKQRVSTHSKRDLIDTSVDLSTSPPIQKTSSPEKGSKRISQKHDQKGKSKKSSKHNRRKVQHHKSTNIPRNRHSSGRKPWVLNPFRQEDEEEFLAKRTHNRRRWSHVFPQGETEFKRHAGPNWKSLCQPAILPTTIDFHPTPNELNDPRKYQFNPYEINLDALDLTFYNNHSELLMEMVRQRLIQNFQLVPQSVLNQSITMRDTERNDRVGQETSPSLQSSHRSRLNLRMKHSSPMPSGPPPVSASNNSSSIQHTLSMGHRIQVLSYNPSSDAIMVVQYLAKFAHNVHGNTHTYNYMLYLPTTKSYAKVSQKFQRYPEEYPWNRLDNLICGDQDKTLSDSSTCFRRINFRIIPDKFQDPNEEQEYVKKFRRLLEYIEEKGQKHSSDQTDLGVQIFTTANKNVDESFFPKGIARRKFMLSHSLKRIVVPLQKGKREKYEWMEMLLDSTFDTKRTYRIMLHWLVASAIKVEAQVQLLQRRCSQYGLRLVGFPQVSLSSNQFLNPLLRPEVIVVNDVKKADIIILALVDEFDFIDDGKHSVEASDVREIFDLNFPSRQRGQVRRVSAQQYVHYSATLLIRVLQDERGSVLFIFLENRRHIGTDADLLQMARGTFYDVTDFIDTINS